MTASALSEGGSGAASTDLTGPEATRNIFRSALDSAGNGADGDSQVSTDAPSIGRESSQQSDSQILQTPTASGSRNSESSSGSGLKFKLSGSARRNLNQLRDTATAKEDKFQKLGRFHNSEQLNVGRQVPLPGSSRVLKTNMQEWTPEGVILHGFLAVGSKESAARRITPNMTDMVALLSRAWEIAQGEGVRKITRSILETPEVGDILRWLWYQRDFDATPGPWEFGALTSLVAPFARYYRLLDEVSDNDPNAKEKRASVRQKWVQQTYDEVLRTNKGRSPMRGILEMMLVQGSIHWSIPGGPNGSTMRSERLIGRSQFMQKNDASTLFECMETFEDALRVEELVKLLSSGLEALVVGLRADRAKQNNRYKAGFVQLLKQHLAQARERGLVVGELLVLLSTCIAHIFYTVLQQNGERIRLTGGMYAVGFVQKQPSCFATLNHHLVRLIREKFRFRHLVTRNPERVSYLEMVLDATLLRRFRKLAEANPTLFDEIQKLAKDLIDFFGGGKLHVNIMTGGLPHLCPGPTCRFDQGDDAKALDKATELGSTVLFGRTAKEASEAKWYTAEDNICEEAFGILFYNITPVTWQRSFGHIEEWPEAVKEESFMTNMRRFLNKKVVRSTASLTSPENQRTILVELVLSEALDEATSHITAQDEQGGCLLLLLSNTGPLQTVQEELGTFLGDLDGSSSERARRRLEMLRQHYQSDPSEWDACLAQLRTAGMSTSSQVFVHAEVPFLCRPFVIGKIGDLTISSQERSHCAESLCRDARDRRCCIDDEFGAPLARVAEKKGSWRELLPGGKAHGPVETMVKIFKGTQMHAERGLARERQSVAFSKRSPTMERQSYTGHCGQILHAFNQGHGENFRNYVTRLEKAQVGTKREIQKEVKSQNFRNAWTQFLSETYSDWADGRREAGKASDGGTYFSGDGSKLWSEMPDEKKSEYASRAAEHNEELKRRSRGDEVASGSSGSTFLGMPFGIGTDEAPLSKDEVLAAAKKGAPILNTDAEHWSWMHLVGLRNASRRLRWSERFKVFVMDRCRIPQSLNLSLRKVCAMKHHGLCYTADSEIYDVCCRIAKHLYQFFAVRKGKAMWGRFFKLEARYSGPYSSHAPLVVLAGFSWHSGNPHLACFMPCIETAGVLRFQPRAPPPGWPIPLRYQKKEVLTDHALAKRLVKNAQRAGVLEGIYSSTITTSNSDNLPGEVKIRGYFQAERVYGPKDPTKGPKKADEKTPEESVVETRRNVFLDGMRGLARPDALAEGMRNQRVSRPKKAGRMKYIGPADAFGKKGRAKRSEGKPGEGSSSSDSDRSSDSDVEKTMAKWMKTGASAGVRPEQRKGQKEGGSSKKRKSASSNSDNESEESGELTPTSDTERKGAADESTALPQIGPIGNWVLARTVRRPAPCRSCFEPILPGAFFLRYDVPGSFGVSPATTTPLHINSTCLAAAKLPLFARASDLGELVEGVKASEERDKLVAEATMSALQAARAAGISQDQV